MGRLYNQLLHTVIHCTLQCLLHIVDFLSVTCLNMVDNDLCGKCSSYRPFRISFLKSIFDSLDILHTAVVERCTEADYEQLLFPDAICISRIIFGCVPGISAKIVWICILTRYQLFLSVCQCIPGFPCLFTLGVRLICSLLNIDCIDQIRHMVCRLLIRRPLCLLFLCLRLGYRLI